MKLTDDLLLVNVPQERKNVQFALYAAHLALGNGLLHNTLRSSTIAQYLLDVAKFLMRYSESDPRRVCNADKTLCPQVEAVLKEVRRHEQVKDKVEPYTLLMHQELISRVQKADDSLGELACCCDFFNLGLYIGPRCSEYAQKVGTPFGQPAVDENGVPIAFCLEDFTFLDENGAKVSLDVFISTPEEVRRIRIRWSHQKNGQHGEVKLIVRNKNGNLCGVVAIHRILRRFIRLCGKSEGRPVAVYRDDQKKRMYLTDSTIAKTMRELACKVYRLDPNSDKVKWSSHSLRVGACVLLHANGFQGYQIKFLLRWRSDCFMEYLRNIALLCTQVNSAVNNADEFPNLI